MLNKKVYLGDSVYCEWDGNQLILTTENNGAIGNRICMDDRVLSALEDFKTIIFDYIQNKYMKDVGLDPDKMEKDAEE